MANEDPFGLGSLMKTWTQSVNEMLEKTAWPGFNPAAAAAEQTESDASTAGDSKKEKPSSGGRDPMSDMATAMKFWQTMASAMATPESLTSAFKGAGTMPDMSMAFTQAVMTSLTELQKKMGQGAARLGESVDAYRFDHLDENFIHVWTEIYEKEFQKFFHIPQLGLNREYMERINDMMDKFNLLQTSQAEFSRLLYMPFQRSMGVMQEKISEMAESGKLPEDANEYYRMWIKILEGHFMTLFQTPEYLTALANTIKALSQFSRAKDEVMEDMLQSLPIAQQSELDDLAKEVYELKRRIRRLEKDVRS